jgi:hypothetical protein
MFAQGCISGGGFVVVVVMSRSFDKGVLLFAGGVRPRTFFAYLSYGLRNSSKWLAWDLSATISSTWCNNDN